MPKKPHYSEKTDEEKIDDIAKRHLTAPKPSREKVARTLYLNDTYFLPAKELLGARISDYVDDCLAHLVEAHKIVEDSKRK